MAYNVTLFVFSELEEMLISHVIIDMDSGHGNEFLIIPNINERKKQRGSSNKKVIQGQQKSHLRTTKKPPKGGGLPLRHAGSSP